LFGSVRCPASMHQPCTPIYNARNSLIRHGYLRYLVKAIRHSPTTRMGFLSSMPTNVPIRLSELASIIRFTAAVPALAVLVTPTLAVAQTAAAPAQATSMQQCDKMLRAQLAAPLAAEITFHTFQENGQKTEGRTPRICYQARTQGGRIQARRRMVSDRSQQWRRNVGRFC